MSDVSVIIPSFEQADFLPEAIESARAQTSPPLEIIIVAQDERSAHVADQHKCKCIRDLPKGVSFARNLGISQAEGRFILPLDADDCLERDFVQRTRAVASRNPFAIVSTNLQEFGERTATWDLPPYSQGALLEGNILGNSSLFTKALWQATSGYDWSLIGFEDWAFWIECSRFDPVVRHVPERLLRYRIHEGSHTHTERSQGLSDVFAAMVRISHRDLYSYRQIERDFRTVAEMPDKARELLEQRLKQLDSNLLHLFRDLSQPSERWSYRFGSMAPVLSGGALPERFNARRRSRELLESLPRQIHFVWLDSPIPVRYAENIETFVRHNPGVEIRLWTDRDPPDCLHSEVRVEREFPPLPRAFRLEKNVGGRADILRYGVVHREGGIYCDVDAVCLRPLGELFAGPFVSAEPHRWRNLTNAVFGFAAGSELLSLVLENLSGSWERRRYSSIPERTGPTFFTTCFLSLADPNIRIIDQELLIRGELPDGFIHQTNDAGWANERVSSASKARRPMRQGEESFYAAYEPGGTGSGVGSESEYTRPLRQFLEAFIRSHNIRSIVDYGCGDWQWAHLIDWDGARYYGYDIVPVLIDRLQEQFGSEERSFHLLDGTEQIPDVDLVICKDVCIHLPNEEVKALCELLTQRAQRVMFINSIAPNPYCPPLNHQIARGQCRPVDMAISPFNLSGQHVFKFGDASSWAGLKTVFLWTKPQDEERTLSDADAVSASDAPPAP